LAACAASKSQPSVPGTDARACSTTADPATVPTGYSTACASPGTISCLIKSLSGSKFAWLAQKKCKIRLQYYL